MSNTSSRHEINSLIEEINDLELVPVPVTLNMIVKILPKGSVITIEKMKYTRFTAQEVADKYNQRLDNREATRQRDIKVFSRDKLLEWLIADENVRFIENPDYSKTVKKGSFGQPSVETENSGKKFIENVQERFKNMCKGNGSVKYEDNIVLSYLKNSSENKKRIYENYIDKNNFFENMVQDTIEKVKEVDLNANPKNV